MSATMESVERALVAYVERGWQPIQLHGLRPAGGCTCRAGTTCKNSGKHPVDKGWQQQRHTLEQLLEDYRRRSWARNVGILTGPPSGLLVLDVDPGNGGADTLAALLAEKTALPDTWQVQTGSGGSHYYFTAPAERIGNSAGRIGAGLDVRGAGGQVVAPPSASGKGSYTVVRRDDVAELPVWLLEALRTPKKAEPAAFSQPRPKGPAVARVAGVLRIAAEADEGSRNGRLYWAACRLGEMVAEGAVDLDAAVVELHRIGNSVGLDDIELVGFDGRSGTIWSGLRRGQAATA